MCFKCEVAEVPFEARLLGYTQGALPLESFTPSESRVVLAYVSEAENRRNAPNKGKSRTRPGTMAHDLTLCMTPGQPRHAMSEAEFSRLSQAIAKIHHGDYKDKEKSNA